MTKRYSVRDHLKYREVWVRGRNEEVVITSKNQERVVSKPGSGAHAVNGRVEVRYEWAVYGEGKDAIVYVRRLPAGRTTSFKVNYFLRKFRPTGRTYEGDLSIRPAAAGSLPSDPIR